MSYRYIFWILMFVFFKGFSQNPDKQLITLKKKDVSLVQILKDLEHTYELRFYYVNDQVDNVMIKEINAEKWPLDQVMDSLCQGTGLKYSLRNERSVVIYKNRDQGNASEHGSSQQMCTYSGIIKDELTGETLPFANVTIGDNGTTANQYGFFSITVPEGQHHVFFSYMGYHLHTKEINLHGNFREDQEMTPVDVQLDEVVITGDNKGIDGTRIKLSKVNIQDVKKGPSLFGEPDLLRSIQLMPGVTQTGEVGRGFQVRGGNYDQNLMILDEAIVYNASHLVGTYSVFNADIIKNVKFYKSDIPANYGGRLSSVMDITQKEGNAKSFHLSGGLGLIMSRLTAEGPIIKDRASFLISGRWSYVGFFFKHVTPEDNVIHNSVVQFYDLNSKINFILNKNNRLYLSSYLGKDLTDENEYSEDYGNITSTLRWNHIYSSKFFSNISLIYSDYFMNDGNDDEDWEWENSIGLNHYEIKGDFVFNTSNHQLELGGNAIYCKYFPGTQRYLEEGMPQIDIHLPEQHSLEKALYISDKINFGSLLEVQAGIRYSHYNYLGKEDIFVYADGLPKSANTIIDTVTYNKNETIQSYCNVEPRLSVQINTSPGSSIKASYSKTSQYVHLISKSISPASSDMWKPSNKYIKPMTGDHFSLGWFSSVFNKTTDLSLEAFYNTMENITMPRPGAVIELNRTLDTDLLQGEGYTYGFECMLEKDAGNNSGSISYTYMNSKRRFFGPSQRETINNGEYFPADYVSPHKVSISYQHKFSKRTSFSANFIYSTGRPVSYPDGEYTFFNTPMPYYSGNNNYKLPDYHRLDVGLVVYDNPDKARKWKGYWTFSIYNVYAHKNPYYIYIRKQNNSKNTEAVRMSILGSLIPSVSYNFNF